MYVRDFDFVWANSFPPAQKNSIARVEQDCLLHRVAHTECREAAAVYGKAKLLK